MDEFCNGMKYSSNYARAAAYYLSTCAPRPDVPARIEAYDLITGIYKAVYNAPSLLDLKALPDAPFEPWERQKGREKDIKAIRDAINKIELLISELYAAITAAEIADNGLLLPGDYQPLKKKLKAVLIYAGYEITCGERTLIPVSRECAQALKELCGISRCHIIHITDSHKEDKEHLYFSRCVFEPEDNWTAKAFDTLLNAHGALIKLCCGLEERGYKRIDCRDGKKISLDYVKLCGKKEEPVKNAWAERSHCGIEVTFEELRLEPCFLWLRMPMFKTVLENAEKLPEECISFLLAYTKSCDGCRYCIQTDKTGTRPLAAISVSGENKCPLYPGFTMNWRSLSTELADSILHLLDTLFPQ